MADDFEWTSALPDKPGPGDIVDKARGIADTAKNRGASAANDAIEKAKSKATGAAEDTKPKVEKKADERRTSVHADETAVSERDEEAHPAEKSSLDDPTSVASDQEPLINPKPPGELPADAADMAAPGGVTQEAKTVPQVPRRTQPTSPVPARNSGLGKWVAAAALILAVIGGGILLATRETTNTPNVVDSVSDVVDGTGTGPVPLQTASANLAPTPRPEAIGQADVETPLAEAQRIITFADLAAEIGLSEFGAALGAVGLGEAIADAGAGPFTIFGPSDAAFGAANGTVAQMDSDQLDRTVRYHIVEGEVLATDLAPGTELITIQGETLVVGEGTVNGVNITSVDNVADNGVVHITDGLLVPASVQQELLVSDLNALLQLEPIGYDMDGAGSIEVAPAVFDTMRDVAEIIKASDGNLLIEIQAHTAQTGVGSGVDAFSQQVAETFVSILVDEGVPGAQLQARGYGASFPIVDPETSPEDEAINRRIEFYVLSGG